MHMHVHALSLLFAKTLRNTSFQSSHAENLQFSRMLLQFLANPQDIWKVHMQVHALSLLFAKTLRNTSVQSSHAENRQFSRMFFAIFG